MRYLTLSLPKALAGLVAALGLSGFSSQAQPIDLPGNLAVSGPIGVPGDGLKGEYWKRTPNTILVDGATVEADRIDAQIRNFGPPDGTFRATKFVYLGNDLSPVRDWLSTDAASYSGSTSNLDDGAFRFSGYINIGSAGVLNIGTTSDDGVRIKIGGLDIVNNDGSHGDVTKDQDVNFLSAGLYPIEITYFNGDWTSDGNNHTGNPDPSVHGGANVHLRMGFSDVTAAQVGMFFQVAPETVLPNVLNIGGNKIGTVTPHGGGSYTVVGGGNDIWDQRDEFTYAFTELTGDFDVQVRVESLQFTANWSKAGLMARESLSEYSRMVFQRVTPAGGTANDVHLAYRTGIDNVNGANGGQHEDGTGTPAYPNAWLRLIRTGSVFTGQMSTDGTTWTDVATQDTATWGGGALPATLYVGLATSRHSGGPTATAEYRDFLIHPVPFTLVQASSRGNPNGIRVTYSLPPDGGHLDPTSYVITPAVNITSVTPGLQPGTVWLNTSDTLTEGTSYNVLVLGPVTAGGATLANDNYDFVHGAGYEARTIRVSHNKTDDPGYYQVSDAVRKGIGDVVALGAGTFPPVEGNTVFEDPIPDSGSNERFSTRISGELNITTTGNYIFYMSSDDNGYLYLSTDDDPANKVQIAREPAWNGVREYINGGNQSTRGTPPANISVPISLQAGKKYYLEEINTEGGGGNNGSATWLPPGGAAVVNGSSPIPESAFAPSRLLDGSVYNLGPVQIVTQPANQTITALQSVTFKVRADGTPRYTYQWRRNGTAIPGAFDSSYTIPVTLPADDGAAFSVVVANEFSSAVSGDATLTVINPEPPHLVSAKVDATFTTVVVTFDNRLDPVTAQNTANYTIQGTNSLTVMSATLAADGKTVVLTTSRQLEGIPYVLVVKDVRELTGSNALVPNPSVATFTSFAFAPGFVSQEQYLNIGGSVNLVDFLNNPKYLAHTPDVTCLSTLFQANSADSCNNCGERVFGYFIPRASGDHVFYVAADDGGGLFLSTDDDPAHKVQIATEPVWSDRRTWTGEANGGGRGTPPSNISAPISLVAGNRYFIEGVVKEGGGGDHVEAAVQFIGSDPANPVDPVPANGSTPITAGNLGTYVDPTGASVAITQSPVDQSVTENATPTFTVVATGSSPLCGGNLTYQWRKNGADIFGANNSSLTLAPVALADDGATFSVVVRVPGRSATSANATLHVSSDIVPPTVVSVVGSATFDSMVVVFSELMDATAADSFNYTLDGGLTVNSAVLNPDGRSVTLSTSPQAQNTVYTVTISEVTDLAGNKIVANTTAHFTSFVAGCGGVAFDYFDNLSTGNNNIHTTLLTDPRFPNSPTARFVMTAFDTRTVFADDSHEGYGGRLHGLFIAPNTGNFIFYLRSDDSSILYLNPTGPSPAGKVQIQEETGCCGAFEVHPSAPIPLNAGQAYYIEAVFKEGTGGDYCQVAARLDGDPTPLAPIPGTSLGQFAPPGVAGAVTITQQPADANLLENQTYTFTVVATNPNDLAICYQWQRDGVAIDGATGPSYSALATLADSGAHFSVVVSIVGNSATSREALLTVTHDTTPPKVLSAQGSEFFDKITVVFDELLDSTSAIDSFNYTVSGGVTVESATLRADGKSVTLTLSAGTKLAENTDYTVTVINVADVAMNHIAGNNTATFHSFVFSCGFLNFAWFNGLSTSDNVIDTTLLADPRYPDDPTARFFAAGADSRSVFPDDSHEGYGARMTGLFIPPASGNWIFYLKSDDSSRLFLNPAGSDPAGKQMIVEETTCCEPFSAHGSAPQALTAGTRYYIEAIYKEGTGGDYCQVAAKLDTDPANPDSLRPISPNSIGLYADATGVTLAITTQPSELLYVIDPNNPTGGGTPLASVDFSANNGGFTVDTPIAYDGPWTYDAAAGSWRQDGQQAEDSHPNTSKLNSPAIPVTMSGVVQLTFSHRWSFEFDGTRWDGGQVRISVNGGPYTTVPASAFIQNGYNSSVFGTSASDLHGQPAFTETSADWANTFVTSIANLGFFNAGDTVSVQFMAASDTNTRGPNVPNWEIKSGSLTQGAQDPTLHIVATGSRPGNPNQAIFYSWQKNTGSGWVDVPDANSANLTLNPTLADNGARYRAVLYIPGTSVTSREVTLTVAQLNTPPRFSCGPNQAVDENSGAQSVAGWATDIVAHSITRVPVSFTSDFSSLPAGTRLLVQGGCTRVEGGVLKLLCAGDPGTFGGWADGPFALRTFESFHADWKSRLGGGGGGGADGYSFNAGIDVPDNFQGEEGGGTGLSVTVDTFDNGAPLDPDGTGIQIKWGGAIVASKPIPKDDDGTGNFLRKDTFVNAAIDVDATGLATYSYDGNVITAQLAGYAGLSVTKYAYGARTGGANDNEWIDDLNIQGFPFDSSSVEASQTVHFNVSNDRPSLFSAQPAVDASGRLTYTPAANASGSAVVTVVAQDSGGTANGGHDTSTPCTFTITIRQVGPGNHCPVANTLSVSVAAGGQVNFQLPATDADGDALQYSVSQAPAHGTVVVQVQTGSASYSPVAGYSGPDSFSYSVTDGQCQSPAAVVSITVQGGAGNHAPTAKIVATPLADFTPDVTHKLLISCNGSNACLNLDGSLSSDQETPTSQLSFMWFDAPSPLAFATGEVVDNCLELGTHTIVLTVTDTGTPALTGNDSLTIEVVTSGEAIDELITKVNNSTASRNNKRPLIATLKAAVASADRGETDSAIGQLRAFQNKVRAQMARTDPQDAAICIRWAQDIIDALGRCE